MSVWNAASRAASLVASCAASTLPGRDTAPNTLMMKQPETKVGFASTPPSAVVYRGKTGVTVVVAPRKRQSPFPTPDTAGLERVGMSLVLAGLDRAIVHGQGAIASEKGRANRACRLAVVVRHANAGCPIAERVGATLERIRQPLGLGHDRDNAIRDGRRQIRKRRPRHELPIAGNPARPDPSPLRRPGHEARGNRFDRRQLRRRHLAVGGQRRDAIGWPSAPAEWRPPPPAGWPPAPCSCASSGATPSGAPRWITGR